MATETSQINVRIPTSLLETVKAECLRQEVPIQEYVRVSLERQLRWSTRSEKDSSGHSTGLVTATFLRLPEDQKFLQAAKHDLELQALWMKFIERMPKEKTEFFTELMRLSLRAAGFRISRRRSESGKKKGSR